MLALPSKPPRRISHTPASVFQSSASPLIVFQKFLMRYDFHFLILLFSYFLVLLFPSSVYALTLNPAIFDVTTDPGKTYRAGIEITNDDTIDQAYYLSIQKFLPQGESGRQTFLPLTDISGLPSWTYFPVPSIQLKPRETLRVPFEIRVPRDSQSGGHYAVIFFSTLPPASNSTNFVSGSRTGALLLLKVSGETREQLELKEFLLDSSVRVTHLPVSFRVLLKNIGNVHATPEGNIRIKNFFGQTVATLPLNPAGSRILPDSERRFVVTWERAKWSDFGFGPYVAELDIHSTGFSTNELAKTRFAVWPWSLLWIFFGFFIVFFAFRIWRRRV